MGKKSQKKRIRKKFGKKKRLLFLEIEPIVEKKKFNFKEFLALWGLTMILLVLILSVLVIFIYYDNQRYADDIEKNNVAKPVPVKITVPKSVQRPIHHKDVREIIRFLNEGHPDSRVRVDFDRLIVNGSIYLNIQDDPNNPHVIAKMILVNVKKMNRNIFTLSINETSLRSSKVSDRLLQLVILHEYEHYLQQLEHRCSSWMIIGVKPEALSEENLREWVRCEIEAYEIECAFAVEQNWANELAFCMVYRPNDLRQFKRSIVISLANVMPHIQTRVRLERIAAEY